MANDDPGTSVAEDSANSTVSILTNDTDNDGNPTAPTNGAGQFTVDLDPSTAGIQTALTNATGVWTYNTATGVVTFDPANNYNGTATITYELCDPAISCDQATITVVVTPANDPPVANDDNGGSLTEDGANGTETILSNDTDNDGNPTAPTNGAGQFTVDMDPGTAGIQTTLTNATGVWTYNPATGIVTFDPANNYNGTATLTYELCDPSAACDQAVITFTVDPSNDPPVAGDDSFSTNEDVSIPSTSLTGNDSDVDNTAAQLTWSLLSGGTAAANGTLVVNADGTFTYVPNGNFTGVVSFTYQVCDPAGACDPATVTITVSPVNDPPVAGDDGFSTNEDVALTNQSLTGNDSDPDNTAAQLNWSLVAGGSAAANGTLVLNANGTFSYTPNANFNGVVSFTYQVCDPSAACDPATVTITVNPLNDTPVALDDSYSTNEDVAITGQTVAGNDSDVETANGSLVWSLLGGGTAAVNGTLLFNADGTFSYTPTLDFTGTVSFTYQVCDPSNACDPATVTIIIGPVNDPPVAGDDAYSVNEDASIANQSLTDNDSDLDNATAQLTWSLVSGGSAAANGTLTLNANGTFSFVPNANFNGTVTFTYQVCDPGPLCDPATVTITIVPVNDTPVANDDGFSMSEDGTLNNTTATNDSDSETANTGLAWSIVDAGSAGANGTLQLNADGTFTYAPNADFTGTVTFTYQVCDPANACDPAVVTIVVNAVNDPPVAGNDPFTMNEDATLSSTVAGNDSDVESPNSALAWSLVAGGTAAANGTLVLNTNGSFTYAPNANYFGTVTFTYQVCDPQGACVQAIATIVIAPVNDAPVANDDGLTSPEDQVLNASVTGNDSDVDNANGQLIWSLTSGGTAAANGTLTFNADGTFSYTPDLDFTGTVSFTYQVCDPTALCDPATVTINIGGANDAPVANDDSFSTPEDNTLTATVIGNDSDADSDPLTFTVVNGGTAAANGAIVMAANGSFTYVPNANFTGSVQFTYQACDPSNACDQAIVTIVVTPVNDPPVANDDGFTTNEDVSVSATLGGNDSDTETPNAGLAWSLINGGSAAANGTLTVNADGTFTYNPAANFNGVVSFTYQLCDPANACDQAIATITVNAVNDPPVAGDDTFTMVEDGTLANQSVTGNDADTETPNASMVWSLLNGGTAAANGTLTFNADGTFTYVPTANFNGIVSFTYEVCDPGPLCDVATVTITVDPANDTPVANDDAFSVNEDAVLSNAVASNDTDADHTSAQLTWTLVSGGTAASNGTLVLNADGTFTYTPNADFNGVVTFTYQACDPLNACDQATVTITVGPVNDPPVANDDNAVVGEDGVLTASVGGNDSDIDNTNAQLVWSLLDGSSAAANGTLVLNGDGTYTYTPNANFNGAVQFAYQVCDPANTCDQATVFINVTPVNDAPVANDDGFGVAEDGVLNADVTSNDSDTETPNASLTWSLVSGGSASANGTLTFNADGTFTYAPNANFNGSVTFDYQVCDPSNVCDAATVTITIGPVNDPPVALNDNYGVIEDGTLVNNVSGNDSDVDNTQSQLTWSVVDPGSAGANGTLTFNADGSFTYVPDAGFNGIVSFTYQVCDPSALCDPAIVTINVGSDNDAPIAGDDAFQINEDGVIISTVSGGDSDPDGDPLTWSLVSGGAASANGTLVLNSDGTFTYTPNANFTGQVSFTYEACDPLSFCDPAVVTIDVQPVNDAPVANDDDFTLTEDGSLTNTVTGNDSDVEGPLTWSLVDGGTAAANGLLVFNPDGTFTYAPNADFFGTVSFTYQACDPGPLCDEATVTITVTPSNDPPVAEDDAFTVDEDGTLSNTVTGNDSDVDDVNSDLTWVLVSGGSAATNGTLTFNANGSFTYVPNADFNGPVSFTYQVCDTSAVCDPAEATIDVLPGNDAPVAEDDSYGMSEGGTLSNDLGVNDSDLDGDALTWSLLDGQSAAANGTLTLNADGTFTYTPNPGFNGAVTFTYQACDPGGLCDDAQVIITIDAVNDAPSVQPDNAITNEDTPIVVDVLANDSDGDGDLDEGSVIITQQPNNGTVVVNVDGTITYTPNGDFTGTDAFQYQVCDDGTPLPAQCATAFVDITVLPVNDAPVGVQRRLFNAGGWWPFSADVTGNDYDLDNLNSELVWSLLDGGTAGQNGVIVFNADGTFIYTPDPNFYGYVSFTYQVCDPSGLCDPATVFIDVQPVNDPPVAVGDFDNILPNVVLTTNVSANDNDTTDASIIDLGSITIIVPPDSGSVVVNGNGTISYTPNNGFVGLDTLIYEICDVGVPLPALCDTAILIINVTNAYPARL